MIMYFDGQDYYFKDLESSSAFFGAQKLIKKQNSKPEESEKNADKEADEKFKKEKNNLK